MISNTTKYPYCRRRYQQVGEDEKHLPTVHLDIVLSLRAHADLTSTGPPAFVRNENINQSDSDYQPIRGWRSQIAAQHLVR